LKTCMNADPAVVESTSLSLKLRRNCTAGEASEPKVAVAMTHFGGTQGPPVVTTFVAVDTTLVVVTGDVVWIVVVGVAVVVAVAVAVVVGVVVAVVNDVDTVVEVVAAVVVKPAVNVVVAESLEPKFDITVNVYAPDAPGATVNPPVRVPAEMEHDDVTKSPPGNDAI